MRGLEAIARRRNVRGPDSSLKGYSSIIQEPWGQLPGVIQWGYRFPDSCYIKLPSRWPPSDIPASSFNNPPLSALPVAHVYLYLPIPPLCSRVQCQIVPYTTCIPDTRREQGDFTNLRMGHCHLCSVLPRRPALCPLLDFYPLCRWCCSRIHNRTVVRFTLRFTHLFPYPDSAFNERLADGTAYTDVLHTYGMSRAGYIPQMFSLSLPNPIVIFELLRKTGARALVCEPSFYVDLSGCPVPNYSAVQVRDQDVADVALPPLRTHYSASDLVFIFHTSGSTSGSPKLVPCNWRWLDNIIAKSK